MLREIGGRPIGSDHPVFVVAEIGLNHSGSLDRALAMVDAAAWAGASAVKLQTLCAADLVSSTCPPPAHVQAQSLRDFFAAFELDVSAHRAIVARARTHGLAVMATPFAEHLVSMLAALDLDAYKIASGDVTFDGLIARAAATGRPLVISSGMSTLAEVESALRVAVRSGADDVAVLHCVSAYPTPARSQNLRAIATLQRLLRVPVGLSDHSEGTSAAIAAVALGAVVYERHLVLDGDRDAVDREVSCTPRELAELIRLMEDTRIALGDGRKVPQRDEQPNLGASRRGLYAARDIPAGTRICAADVAVLRPASELAPSQIAELTGSVLRRDVREGEPFEASDIALERAS